MSVERRRPVEEEMGINEVEDSEIARKGAESEKYLRDVAREPHITDEEKDILDILAEGKGEEAIKRG